MVQNKKVLTVSYGAFSCTLEGFDNSFETLKAIADYFREIAADDRYFGSEPPRLDAEMLSRIAQGDNAQHVEARQDESGLLLRATKTAPDTAPETATKDAAMSSHRPPSPTTVAAPSSVEPPATNAEPLAADSISAKLQRIRAVVTHSNTAPITDAEDEDTSLLGANPAPIDAVAAAFEAGALSQDDIEPAREAEQPIANEDTVSEASELLEDEAAVYVQPASNLASETEEPAEGDTITDDIMNIMGDQNAPAPAEDAIAQGVLTAEDEKNLLDNISSFEAGMAGGTDEKPNDESTLDQDVLRLMEKADQQMGDPSASGTRETYSHLRNAVAAAEVDGKTDTASADQPYRGDLASAVSPRRPEIQVTSMRPESDAAAPLKLVAEQRVDQSDAISGPIAPRRVKTDQEDSAAEESGFAQFAQEQGAQSLLDLLEAAASYLSFIEGQEQFSRPQLMNKVRSLKQDEFNREESLRSFGQLLRDGKIQKAGGGRFAASNLIGFRPDNERAAG
ncbi:hypothetical protein ABLN87_04735 [Ruegeria sp. SCPT10]|uniref:hypothetical protein n=1 Tax=Ruegeria sp. SCP10 TaxID=3141377 RepID=UPI003336BB20